MFQCNDSVALCSKQAGSLLYPHWFSSKGYTGTLLVYPSMDPVDVNKKLQMDSVNLTNKTH